MEGLIEPDTGKHLEELNGKSYIFPSTAMPFCRDCADCPDYKIIACTVHQGLGLP